MLGADELLAKLSISIEFEASKKTDLLLITAAILLLLLIAILTTGLGLAILACLTQWNGLLRLSVLATGTLRRCCNRLLLLCSVSVLARR